MVLPYDFDIFWPSMPGSTPASARREYSGTARMPWP